MTIASVQIRRAVPADAAALAEFAARTFSEAFGAENSPSDMADHLDRSYGVEHQTRELLSPDYVTLLAEADGGLAAFAQVRRGDSPPCVTSELPVELLRFYVDKRWHGRGLAHRLMEEVRRAVRTLGGREVWLGVWELNPRAIAFYAKCGFRDVGTKDFYVGPDRQTDRVMVADLDRSVR